MAAPAVIAVFSTFPTADKAIEVARILVQEGLVACVNVLPQVRSIYRWQGNVNDDQEVLAVIKTTRDRFEAMRDRLVGLHPYEVAEVIALPVEAGHLPYLSWVAEQTKAP